MLNKIQDATQATEQKDVLGGSRTFDTDVYDAVIKMAYFGESSGGAISLTFHFDIDGTEFRNTLYVTNKQKKTFYYRDDKEVRLPGFILADNISLLTTEKGLLEHETEDRVIKKYDVAQQKEVNTTVPVIVEMLNQKVSLGIVKQEVNKSVKVGDAYKRTAETREENAIDKVFYAEDGRTVVEIQAGKTEAEFKPAWVAKNQGKLINRVKPAEVDANAQAGAPTPSATPAPKKSLFNK